MGRSLLIAGLSALIPLAGNVVVSFLTESAGVGRWLAVPAMAVAVAMVQELLQAYRQQRAEASRPAPAPDEPPRPEAAARGRGTPLPAALAIAVVVLGVGGWGVAEAVRYVSGRITGNEPGTERLRDPVTATASGLTLTVDSVQQTAHFTRVGLAARNATGTSLSLPLFRNCRLVGADGTTLEADAFKSRFSEDLAPGGLQRGTIVFDGHLPGRVRSATLAFSTVFAQGFEGPRSIQVPGIRLRRPV